jgi:hypothetical protein
MFFLTPVISVANFTACFNGKKGDVVKVLTQFGVHLIQITDQKNFNLAAQIFTIAKQYPTIKTQTIQSSTLD